MDFFLSSENHTTLAKAALAAVVVVAVGYARSSRKSLLPLPPGPPGLPLIGNVLDIPAEDFWLKYIEWSKQYGSDVISLNMLGTPIIVLNSLAACKELIENRSAIYSSRPYMPMLNDLIGFHWNFAFMPYNEAFKKRRKLFQGTFHPTKTDAYRPKLLKAIRVFLPQTLDEPEHCLGHARMLAGAFVLDVSYGLDIVSKDDIYIVQAERALLAMSAAGTASTYAVDFIPWLRHLPWWFPGAKFKADAAVWSQDVKAMPRDCLHFTEDNLKRGKARPSVAAELLEKLVEDEGDEVIYNEKRSVIHDLLGSIYTAGSDTIVSSFSTFLLVMVQNPQVQKRAKQDIDKYFSEMDRLPDSTDYRTLPYVEAIVREVLRWRPVTPVALPRMVTQDDVYQGYHIPARSTVLINTWALSHDPAVYGPDTDAFRPSRFMNEAQTEINPDMPMGQDTFGLGRRICPGLHIAVEAIWMFVVSVLAVYDIGPAEACEADTNFGKYTSGMLSHPYHFKLRIVPRSEAAETAIRNGIIAGV